MSAVSIPQTAPAATALVIVGAGLAGWTTAREFRKLDANAPIVLVTADSGDFYAKPTLSNACAQKRSAEQLVTTPAAKMAETLNVTLLAHTQVQSMDAKAQTLTLSAADGATQTLAYSHLVLATGAHPIRVPLQGDAATLAQSINHLGDLARFQQQLGDTPKTVLIMGAGLIGCEFANDLLQGGHTVHVVDPAERPLAALLPAEAGDQLRAALQALGVVWHFGTTVQALNHQAGATGFLATLGNGEVVAADMVLSAIGLRADIALAQAAGIACERGVVVNELLQTSAAHVFALGDNAQYASAGARTLPYVMPIMNAARALAATLAGRPTAVAFPLMPVSIKTPALPTVIAAPHPALPGSWIADAQDAEAAQTGGVWRFMDAQGQQRGFALTGKQSSRRMELAKTTVL
jgi:rubredoxin-NAD+ reductase